MNELWVVGMLAFWVGGVFASVTLDLNNKDFKWEFKDAMCLMGWPLICFLAIIDGLLNKLRGDSWS